MLAFADCALVHHALLQVTKEVEKTHWKAGIATEIVPAGKWWDAEVCLRVPELVHVLSVLHVLISWRAGISPEVPDQERRRLLQPQLCPIQVQLACLVQLGADKSACRNVLVM